MAKKPKLDLRAQEGPALVHNPFAALAGATAREAPQPAPSASEPEPPPSRKRSRGRLILRRETKSRGGKAVVIVSGCEQLPEPEVETLARDLKQQLACGGSVQSARGLVEIVVQGDQPARVAELLRAWGFRVDGVTS